MAAMLLTDEQIAGVKRHNDRIIAALDQRQWHAALLANRDFHFQIYECVGSDVFSHLIESLWLQVGPFLVFSMRTPAVRWTTEHHLAVIEALSARNAADAARAIAADIDETARHLLGTGVFLDDAQTVPAPSISLAADRR